MTGIFFNMKTNNKNYSFIEFMNDNDYRYRCQSYDKKKFSLYIRSFDSAACDLNTNMTAKVTRHKDVIDSAIKFIEGQLKRGATFSTLIYPSNLRKEYRWYVNQFVKTKLRLAKNKQDTKGSQKYWVPNVVIKTYGFRDKDRTSKFQCFVEFLSADAKETETIKMNLRMSKKAYENRHLFYLDGFDLVFREDSINVRHVSEKLVERKEDNGITRYMTIDAWTNIHSVITDKTFDNEAVKAVYDNMSKDDKAIYGKLYRTHNRANLRKVLHRAKSMSSKHTFYDDCQSIKNAIHSKVMHIINSCDESKVVLLIPTGIQSNLYDIIIDKFVSSVSDECKKHGIQLDVQLKPITDIKETVLKHRQRTNEVSRSYGRYSNKELKSHLKWSELAIAAVAYNYKDTYPALFPTGKFTEIVERRTEQNDARVLRPERPCYARLFHARKLCTTNGVCDEAMAREIWLASVRSTAQEYYKQWLELHPEAQKQSDSDYEYDWYEQATSDDEMVFV